MTQKFLFYKWGYWLLHTVGIWTFTFHEKSGCVWGDLKGQFQTSLQVKVIIFLNWKFRSIILIFFLFFAGIVKSSAFCTLLLLFQKGWYVWVTFFHQIATQTCQLIGIAATVCKKQWIWQLLPKIEGKWE